MTSEELIKSALATTCFAVYHIGEVARIPEKQWTATQFDQIMLWLREANCAVTELQNRSKGNLPSKIGD